MTSAPQILKQAEVLKSKVADTSRGLNEAWINRQSLQDLYQTLLIVDLEYALDKKVEQDLWNHAFKNQINTLQSQTREKTNPKRPEIQSSLNLFLETASGFYIQLLQQICSAFKLDLPFRRRSSHFGVLKEYRPVASKMRTPRRSSCMYISQHCLVHLGDIARYRQEIDQAQTYYRHAALLVPSNGQPYNQLAILEAAKGNKLSTVFFYIRSLAVKHPFPVASTNLDKLYAKIAKDNLEFRGKLSLNDIISAFLQFQAGVHLAIDFEKARRQADKLVMGLPAHITSLSFSTYQLLQIMAINFFAMDHTTRSHLAGEKEERHGSGEEKENIGIDNTTQQTTKTPEQLSSDELAAYNVLSSLTVGILEHMLSLTPKQEQKAKEYHTLPVIKLCLDWLRLHPNMLDQPLFASSKLWPNLAKLLNNLQFHLNQRDPTNDVDKLAQTPLPEDYDLQEFLPIHKAFRELHFTHPGNVSLSVEEEVRLRCHRLIQHAVWITDNHPDLLKVQKLKSGKLQFMSPVPPQPADTDIASGSEKKGPYSRQNVAIQAIMQKAKKTEVAGRQEDNTTAARIQHTPADKGQHKSDVSIRAPPTADTGIPEKTEDRPQLAEEVPSFALPLKPGQVIVAGMQLTRPASSSLMGSLAVGQEGNRPASFNLLSSLAGGHGAHEPDTSDSPLAGLPTSHITGPIGLMGPSEKRTPGLLAAYPGAFHQKQDTSPGNLAEPTVALFNNQTRYQTSRPVRGQHGDEARQPSQTGAIQSPPNQAMQPGVVQSPGQSSRLAQRPMKPNLPRFPPPQHSPPNPQLMYRFNQAVNQPHFLQPPDYRQGSQSNAAGTVLLNMLQQKTSTPVRMQGQTASPVNDLPFLTEQNILKSVQESASYQAADSMSDIFALLEQGNTGSPIRSRSPNYYTPTPSDSRPQQFSVPPPASTVHHFVGGPFTQTQLSKPNTASSSPVLVGGGSLYGSLSSSQGSNPDNSSTYQLFSGSPWSVQLTPKPDPLKSHSHSPSPYSSAQSSLRTTPDPFSISPEPSHNPGYKYGSPGAPAAGDTVWRGPVGNLTNTDVSWGLQKGDGNWRPQVGAATITTGAPGWTSQPPPTDSGQFQNNNIQMWMSGPSPLEKLLEQQKQQRHGDPH